MSEFDEWAVEAEGKSSKWIDRFDAVYQEYKLSLLDQSQQPDSAELEEVQKELAETREAFTLSVTELEQARKEISQLKSSKPSVPTHTVVDMTGTSVWPKALALSRAWREGNEQQRKFLTNHWPRMGRLIGMLSDAVSSV